MTDGSYLEVGDALRIPLAELTYRASRAGGPGGQHVNTSSTRVELTWAVSTSSALSDEQRARILDRLSNRIDASGVLRLASGATRSQLRNREAVTERLQKLLADALRETPTRRRTRPPKSAREERLRAKRRRADIKAKRGPVEEAD
jgi:ribosome-associated protein